MARSVYVAGLTAGAGKSVVALGVAELLSRRIDRLGIFRPLGGDGPDAIVELLRERYHVRTPDGGPYGVTYAEAGRLLAQGRTDELVARIVERYRECARPDQTTLVIGSDLDEAAPEGRRVGGAHELSLHARLAAEFGSVMLPVVDAHTSENDSTSTRETTSDGTSDSANTISGNSVADSVRTAYHAIIGHGVGVVAVVANRVSPADRDALLAAVADLAVPVYAIPEIPELASPTVAEVGAALRATRILGDETALGRDVRDYVVGGALVPTVLDHLTDGCLLITPGDRTDLVVASCAAHAAGLVSLAGIVMTLGLPLDPRVVRLVEKLGTGLALLSVPGDSFDTVTHAGRIEARLSPASGRKIEIALGVFERAVNTAGLAARVSGARSERVTPMMFEYDLIERARADHRHLVLPEGDEERVLRATEVLLRRGVAELTLLGNPTDITRKAREMGLDIAEAHLVDPLTSPWREEFATAYADLRRAKGVTLDQARDIVTDVNYFGTLMVHLGRADGMVSGAVHTTAATIRPAFQIIRTRPEVSVASSVFFMCLADRVLVYGDCAINPDPDAAQLADIAISSAQTAARFGVQPRVAMLSYSTGASGTGTEVEKVAQATELVRKRSPDLPVEGPIQYDAAIDPAVAATKLPGSSVAGRATVFIFPDLNTGNNTYKAVQRSAGAVAIGPVVQGLRRPVNDLSRGATVTDIVNTVAITAIQAAEVS